ncbi:hypothetical protein Pmar_PMAR013655 [Perkinsus marinus ATCC 50983]|uniref:Uncharacterized protein n=1 Tax=Perkinsus marinus (strain ATCC 50983 / TXsc) TaxID=423536 RepID=C5LXX9_PERM5|nr:hypothetical protein Pmar_PMAR013655 [Perkinsus marinus ATCC 50983]EEQ98309.1 hypothetical protein Pmar_PMAR013655 [Perkinsus marinus ATCC 50983]|eukprot:XP_002765592.1 hypothetical protein Pmar_PMAR013655 [Perkinsus marinus ATCC 50983]
MNIRLARRFLDYPCTFYMLSFVISTILLSVFSFVPPVARWFGPDIAALALMTVVLAAGDCLCNAGKNSMKVINASMISLFLVAMWTLAIRAVFDAVSAEYNSYIGSVWALPLMVLHAFAYTVKPINEVYSVPLGALMVCTVPIYGGMTSIYSEIGRCMLASIAASVVTFGVTCMLSLIRCRSSRLCGSSKMSLAEADSALLTYFHTLCNTLMSPSEVQEDYDLARAASAVCQKTLYQAWKQADDEGALRVTHLQAACFGNLVTLAQTIHPPRSGKPLSFPAACGGLVTASFMLKFTSVVATVSENSLPSEELLTDLIQSSMSAHITQGYKSSAADAFALQAAVIEMARFVRAMRRVRMATTQYVASTMGSFKVMIKMLARYFTMRIAMMMLVSTLLYTVWEGRDDAIDAYALWGLLPGLMILQLLPKGGAIRAVYCVAPLFAWTLLGSALGLASAESNRGSISAYATQMVLLAAIASYLHRGSLKKVSGPILAYLSWLVVAVANRNDDEGRDSLAIWHVALYRIAIVCTGVFLAMIFVMLPPPFRLLPALDGPHKHLVQTAVDVAVRSVVKANRCYANNGVKAEGQSALAYSRSMSRPISVATGEEEEEKPQIATYSSPIPRDGALEGVDPHSLDLLVHFPPATKPLLRQSKLQDNIMRRGGHSANVNDALVDLSYAALAVAGPAKDCRLGREGAAVAGDLIVRMEELLGAIKISESNIDITTAQQLDSSSWVKQAVMRLNVELTKTRTMLWAGTVDKTDKAASTIDPAEKFLLTGLLQIVSLAAHLVHFGDCWMRLEEVVGIESEVIVSNTVTNPFISRGQTSTELVRVPSSGEHHDLPPFVARSRSAHQFAKSSYEGLSRGVRQFGR